MPTPVFLSVSGEADALFARAVHQLLGESLAYHYQVTGEESTEFLAEIEAKINECRIFVAFWSEDFLKSPYARDELAYFRKIVESGSLEDRQLVVVPRGEKSPDIQLKWINPISQENEFILGVWRHERAIDLNADAVRVAEIIRKKLAHLKVVNDVLIPRGWLTDQIKNAVTDSNFKSREVLFVTGLEGQGRRSALVQYMQIAFPNRVPRFVSLDSIDGPQDLLIHLMEAAAISVQERVLILQAISAEETADVVEKMIVKELRRLLHLARNSKSYYVIAIDRFVSVDAVSIPVWLSEVLQVFSVGGAPLVLLVTSSPMTDAQLRHYPHAGRVRIPGLEEKEMDELVYRLTQEDPSPGRWLPEKRSLVARAANGSPALCKSIMRSVLSEPNLDFVDQLATRAEGDFGQTLAALSAHWIKLYEGKITDLLALRVIEKLGVTSKEILDELLQPSVAMHGPYNLYVLRDQGLVEQLSDGIYRIPPLIQRRLGSALWGKISDFEIDSVFKQFASKVLVSKTEYGAIYASNVATTMVRTGVTNTPPEYSRYLTLSMLFKSGLDRYSNKDWTGAHRILQRSIEILVNAKSSLDMNTKIEVARFAGLAAARCIQKYDVEFACDYLEREFKSTKRAKSALGMAKFVKGFQFRLGRSYDYALDEYREALELLKDEKFVERQRAAVYTEMTSTYLRTSPPQFENALRSARLAFSEKNVTHTLNALVYALVLFVFRGGTFQRKEDMREYLDEIESFLTQLQQRSKENGTDFYTYRQREYVREERLWDATRANSGARVAPELNDLSELEYF